MTDRIIDANFNRAREALRVAEDYARFILDDAGLAGDFKRLRHDLAAIVSGIGGAALLIARDTPHDVGTDIKTETEVRRASASDVAVAACKRLSEALRVIEEYAKIDRADAAGAVERLRYRAYELERRLGLRALVKTRFAGVRLYVLITETLCRNDWLRTAAAAVDGGADCLQLREKSLPDGELLRRARSLASLCRERGVPCIINDRADIALRAGADGVHVGQGDLPVDDVRRIAGPDLIVGASTHTPEQARDALADAPDYVAVGPMFASATKPQDHIAGVDTLKQVLAMTTLPVAAIGGITPGNVWQVTAAGGRCICACSAVISAEDVAAAARRLRETV